MRGILVEKIAADLKVSEEAFESAVNFPLNIKLQKPDLKLKTKQQKALEALVIQKRDFFALQFGAANRKSDRNGFYQGRMCLALVSKEEKTSGNEIISEQVRTVNRNFNNARFTVSSSRQLF